MAFNAGSVQGKLELDAGDFLSALKRAKQSLDTLDKANKRSISTFTKFRNAVGLVRDAVIILPAAFRAVTAPLRGLLGFLRESSAAAAQFEVTVRKFSTALALAGNTGVQRITDRVKGFADAFQDLTGISNTATLQVAQTLTVLGVQQKDLEQATTAVMNYAEAMGRDAVMAALQFGRTLSGLIGELGEALPAVRNLTQEQLRQGEAFRVAGDLFAGTAEQVAQTTAGLRRSFVSAFGDLQRAVGDAINPVLDAITKGGTEAVKALTRSVRDNEPFIREAFANVAKAAVGAARGILEFGLNMPVYFAELRAFFAELVAFIKTAGLEAEMFLLGFFERIQQQAVNFAAALEGLPGNLGRMATIVKADLVVGLEDTKVALIEAEAAAKSKTKELEASARAAKEEAAEQRRIAGEIRSGNDTLSARAQLYNSGREILDEIESSLGNINTKEKEFSLNVSTVNRGFRERLQHLREFTGLSAEAKGHAELMNQVLVQAKANTEGLAGAARETAAGFRDAARAAGSIGDAAGRAAAGGGGGDGGDEDSGLLLGSGFGRTRGGSAGLDLSTIAGATAALKAARTAGRASVGGLYSHAARQSAFIVGQQIESRLQSLTDQAFSDFTSDLIDELNRMGVLDPVERNRYISERTREAQRYGLLPQERTVSAFVGAMFK